MKTGTVARRGARVHQSYRQPSVSSAKPGRRGYSPLDEDHALRLGPKTHTAEPVRERPLETRAAFRHRKHSLDRRDSRSMPLVRTGAISVAFFGDQQETQSRNCSDEKEIA